jgi:putative transposase
MPWQECSKMDERLRFVARLLEGEKMAVLCREFDISRKTGYKIFSRYKDSGLEGLTDRSRRPYRQDGQLPFQLENLILQVKAEHPSWGCPEDPREGPPQIPRDYKGEFMLADRRYCYPLTITDAASRYLLCCEALHSTQASLAFTALERIFKDFGLPAAIRTDNGVPFASPNALFGLSKLSVWWLRLGIQIERMHLTLKKEATKPPLGTF